MSAQSYLPDIHRTLPHSVEAEQGVLGSMLISPLVIGECVQAITAAHFHIPAHAAIFGVLVEFWAAQKPLDFITLTQVLRDRGALDVVGGPLFITELFTFVPAAVNVSYYLETVREKRTLRELIRVCTDATARSYDGDGTALQDAQTSIMALGVRQEKQTTHIKDFVGEALDYLDGTKSDGDAIFSGLTKLDEQTGGWKPGDVVVIGAETKGGKTALALRIVEHSVVEQKKSAVVFSLEMSGRENAERLLSGIGRVDGMKIRRRAGFTEYDFAGLTRAGETLNRASLHIVTSARSLPEVIAVARQFHARNPLALIVLDYAQLLQGVRLKDGNREQEVASVSRGMKGLASELGAVALVLSQLTDEGRLRESRALGHDANCVLGIEAGDDPRMKFINVIAQRSGPSGGDGIPVVWLADFARFENCYNGPEI